MMRSNTIGAVGDADPIRRLTELVPEFREHYPITIVMDTFADRVANAIREGGSEEFVERAFAFVERLAATRVTRWENLVSVCFLEAAPWGAMGAKRYMGSETLRVLSATDPQLVDPELL
jgi:hypothetical protein